MKIRTQLTLYFGSFVLIFITTIFLLNYSIVHNTLVEYTKSELIKTERSMHQSSKNLLSTSIKNYLRGITAANLNIIEKYYADFVKGNISEREAKDRIQAQFLTEKVGQSGYPTCIKKTGNKLFLDIHPFLRGFECTDIEGCQQLQTIKNGYIEYNWKNPEDNSFRKKAAYIRYFPEWRWIVAASSYRDEFVNLVQLEDLKKLIQNDKSYPAGYFFLFNENYKILIHPTLENTNGRLLLDDGGRMVLKRLKESPDGFITYKEKNADGHGARVKYAAIMKLEDYNWYLVASGDFNKLLTPIKHFRNMTYVMLLLTGIVLALLIYQLSRKISQPLVILKNAVAKFDRSKKPVDWKPCSIHEIDILGNAFAQTTDELNHSMHELHEKMVELAISEQEKTANGELLDNIINSMPSAIIGITPELRITIWNNKAKEISGHSETGVHKLQLLSVFPNLLDYRDTIIKSMTRQENNQITYEYKDDTETIHINEMTIYPLVSSSRRGAVIRIDDVTDRIELEKRLRQSQKMDAIGQLAGGIAHDFNNMLSGMMGAADLLHIKADPELQPLITIISNSADRASQLIQKLLTFSRQEKIVLDPLDVHAVIDDTVEILEHTLDKKITIIKSLRAKKHIIVGDRSQLHNSLLNIGINGGQAMANGGNLSFTTHVVRLGKQFCEQNHFNLSPGWFIQITISDNGCGIPAANKKRIFEPFFTTKQQNRGTGLGLAAVYGTIVQHKGAVSVHSETDIGTEFHLLLPLRNDISGKEQIVQEHDSNPEITGEGLILVIDDEPVIRTTAMLMLEKLGYNTIEAGNGREGVEIYSKHRHTVQLILLDMIMPVMDGSECFTELRRINPEVRVIISSGFSRNADLAKLREEGLCGFIKKPYTITELGKTVAQAINDTTDVK